MIKKLLNYSHKIQKEKKLQIKYKQGEEIMIEEIQA
jgi:hypothetical protein